VETEGKKYYCGGILLCTADLKRVAKMLETLGDELVPFEEYQSEWGKGIKFCHARATQLACDAYGVMEKTNGCSSNNQKYVLHYSQLQNGRYRCN
jgi:hypothetical protein